MSTWIDTNEQLEALCNDLTAERVIALDTEFIRTDTFYPKLALIQVSNGRQCWLIDVLQVTLYNGLKALLEDDSRVIILHACAEDTEVLEYALDIRLAKIFDTQIAAGIVNTGYSMGYARLLESLLGIQLDKQQTRSNWLARPLSTAQLQYAEDDVTYLHQIHELLSKKLDQFNRWSWLDVETEAVVEMVAARKDVEGYYQKVKGAHRLSPNALAVLKRLCDWREVQARELNRPRGHICKDPVLLDLAVNKPTNKAQLYSIEGLYARDISRYGEMLLAEISAAAYDPEPPCLPQPLGRSGNLVIKELRVALAEVALEQQIPAEYLISKKELESLLRSLEVGSVLWPERLARGWRSVLVKPVIDHLLPNLSV